jgi:UDP-2,3-diacylglucosamine pyrophosphatase LpxH
MKTTVLVISDLHLGGPEGFQMCTPPGVDRLAAFLRWAGTLRRESRQVHLVLAGDVVDFLAEPDDEARPRAEWTWSAFAADEALALDKLERILERTRAAWDALSDLVAGSVALTLLLGNHDVELSLPRVRRRLLDRIAPSGGRVAFLYDGEAFALGELLVEHGNRYEGWNAVSHDGLRRVRSRLSRGQPAGPFAPQPGSELVAQVMNRIKAKYAFVDLLKPETGGALPILAVLDPGLWTRAGRAIAEGTRAAWRQARIGPRGPRAGDLEAVAAAPGGRPQGPPPPAPPYPDDDAIALADELAAGAVAEGLVEDLESALLLRAFRKRQEKDQATFDVGSEASLYLEPARALAASGHRVVVFGHTHQAKRVRLEAAPGEATYLNTGTWADLMRIPTSIYQGSEKEGRAALRAFLAAVRTNDIARYRRQVATFARVDLEGDRATSSDLLFFDGEGEPEPISTEGVLRRLEPDTA